MVIIITKKQLAEILTEIDNMFPNATCELNYENPFQLTIAVLLSAQCTDNVVNKVTAKLFKKYKKPEDFLAVPISELELDIKSIGLYRTKAKNIKKLCETLISEFNGEIPQERAQLMKLAGVGRKTANVVLAVAFNIPAIAVDTHVERVTKRLGICKWKDSVLEVETTLMKKIPEHCWAKAHHQLIFFGRYHCKAQAPKCDVCPLLHLCREGKKRQKKKE